MLEFVDRKIVRKCVTIEVRSLLFDFNTPNVSVFSECDVYIHLFGREGRMIPTITIAF